MLSWNEKSTTTKICRLGYILKYHSNWFIVAFEFFASKGCGYIDSET